MTARPQHIGDLFDPRFAARRSDPPTSHEAARRNPFAKMNDLRRVLEIHYRHQAGLTDFELAEIVRRKQPSAGKRRGELRDAGLIEQTTERRPSDTGSPATVWRITEKGIAVARELIQERSCAC